MHDVFCSETFEKVFSGHKEQVWIPSLASPNFPGVHGRQYALPGLICSNPNSHSLHESTSATATFTEYLPIVHFLQALNILRKLFIESVVMSVDVNYMETIHESGSGNSPALTSQKALSEFMRLVSVVSSSLFSNHQIIGIGLAVRVLFHQNHSGKSMKLSMHQNSFSTMRTNSRGSVGSDRGSPRSSSPVPVSSGTSGEGSGVEMSTSGAALSSGHRIMIFVGMFW